MDIFTNDPKDHCTLYHLIKKQLEVITTKKSIQYSFILEGNFLMYSAEVDNYGKIKNNLKKNCEKK